MLLSRDDICESGYVMADSEAFPKIYLVRHGETAWSLSRQYTGRADIPLTARGERDAVELGAHLKGREFLQVLVSPLLRARQTAKLIGFGEHADVEPDLMEWDYGRYEGRRAADVQAERPGWDLFRDGCPGGESLADLGARADRVVAKLRATAGDVLIVAHRDILRILIARWIGLQPIDARRFYLDTASLSIIGYQHSLDEPAVRLLNASGENIL
jgi:broad specificity phosphatase PhoE